MKLTDFKVLTFDCYGTLIDWETGIHNALAPLLARRSPLLSKDEALEIFARHETAQQSLTPTMPYSQLLSVVYQRIADEFGVQIADREANIFGASVPDWPEFPDSVEALAYLKQHYKLVVLSNVDRISFRSSNVRLKVAFDALYSAQDVGSYKPDRNNFVYLLEHLKKDFGLEKSDVLFTAQSLYHDHVGANAFGMATAWIDRRHAVEGFGATMPPAQMPHIDFHFTSLAEMAKAHRLACGA